MSTLGNLIDKSCEIAFSYIPKEFNIPDVILQSVIGVVLSDMYECCYSFVDQTTLKKKFVSKEAAKNNYLLIIVTMFTELLIQLDENTKFVNYKKELNKEHIASITQMSNTIFDMVFEDITSYIKNS